MLQRKCGSRFFRTCRRKSSGEQVLKFCRTCSKNDFSQRKWIKIHYRWIAQLRPRQMDVIRSVTEGSPLLPSSLPNGQIELGCFEMLTQASSPKPEELRVIVSIKPKDTNPYQHSNVFTWYKLFSANYETTATALRTDYTSKLLLSSGSPFRGITSYFSLKTCHSQLLNIMAFFILNQPITRPPPRPYELLL